MTILISVTRVPECLIETQGYVSNRRQPRRAGFRASLMSLVLFVGTYVGAAAAEEFRLLASWSPAYVGHAEIAQRFIGQMERREDVDVAIRIIGPEAIPPFEQFQPAAAGLVDLLFTHGAYHVGESGIGVALDAVTADTASRRSSG